LTGVKWGTSVPMASTDTPLDHDSCGIIASARAVGCGLCMGQTNPQSQHERRLRPRKACPAKDDPGLTPAPRPLGQVSEGPCKVSLRLRGRAGPGLRSQAMTALECPHRRWAARGNHGRDRGMADTAQYETACAGAWPGVPSSVLSAATSSDRLHPDPKLDGRSRQHGVKSREIVA
jgi:hypothetical protein